MSEQQQGSDKSLNEVHEIATAYLEATETEPNQNVSTRLRLK